MFRNIAVSLVCFAGGACTTLERLEGLSVDATTCEDGRVHSGDENLRFDALVFALCKDRNMLTNRERDWDFAEQAFGLALLASATYGAYNTAFAGDNLKDAAFAAVTITSLRSLISPAKRRDAHAKAARRLRCVVDAAEVFNEPYQPWTQSLASGAYGLVLPQSVYSMAGAVNVLNGLGISSSPEATRSSVLYAAQTASEQEIYNRRFKLVSSTYMKLVNDLHAETRSTVASYDDLTAQHEAAIKKNGRQ